MENRDFGDPDGDEERPLMEHILELRDRMVVTLVGIIILSVIAFIFSFELIGWVVEPVMDPSELVVYDPLETILIQFNFSFIFAIGVGLPLIIYEAFKFMEPGLFENEKRFFALITPGSVLLFFMGVAVAYFLVVPVVANLVFYMGEGVVEPAISIELAYNFVMSIIATFGFLFQLPIVMLLAIKIDLISPTFLKDKRIFFYIGFFVIASIVSPDPTLVSQMIVTVVFIILYEASLAVGWYLTPRTEQDIKTFFRKFERTGGVFGAGGGLLAWYIAIQLGLPWWILVSIVALIFYIGHRLSFKVILNNKIMNVGILGPIIAVLAGYTLLEPNVNEITLIITTTILIVGLTYLLETVQKKLVR
ncbi:Sec-independent protein secretion pathway component TatC [Methanonatronarchaeum thermophilum]|uniref:Sec-independent protein translocase protein TatC n=1 Tax=Methanonatronarchaeum thermophilum TaxID=1927129 RepID=A0A1Y3GCP7_9EURY|nr:twin-arginine translocase subunit TatC [Methanonatronarchaeum thermophilum]OUJ19231.1 Sec-independent protein secretion pathway component TatC [Methanonatronarchaeum thermophilum]